MALGVIVSIRHLAGGLLVGAGAMVVVAAGQTTNPMQMAGPATGPTTGPAVAASAPATGVTGFSRRVPTTLPAAAAARAEKLIKQLGDDDWKKRKGAESGLADMGPMIVPRLQKLVESTTDEEVRGRAEAALATIDDRRHFGATPIYLDAHDEPLKAVVDEVLAQDEAPPEWSAEAIVGDTAWPGVTLHADGEPFWQVVREIQEQVGLDVAAWRPSAPDQFVGVVPDTGGVTVVNGPFITIARNIESIRSMPLGGATVAPQMRFNRGFAGGRGQGLYIHCVVLAEPKLCLMRSGGAGGRVVVTEAEDNLGNSLLLGPQANAMIYNAGPPMTAGWATELQLKAPSNAARMLHKLAGQFTVMVATNSEVIEVDNILHVRTISRTVGAKQFVIHPIEKLPSGIYQVQVDASCPPNMNQDWQDIIQLAQQPQMELLDPTGRSRFMLRHTQTLVKGNMLLGSIYQFLPRPQINIGVVNPPPAAPDETVPLRLEWRIATGSKPIDGTFAFADLPLP